MRKPTDERLAIGALIAFAVWIFVALPLYYGPRDNSAARQCSAKETENYSIWEKTRCDPLAYFTFWLVGFTGVLAVSTIGLWFVTWRGSVRQSSDMEASLRHSREALTAVERAFLFVKEIAKTTIRQQSRRSADGLVVLGTAVSWIVTPVWENSGRTPARRVVVNFNCNTWIGNIPEDFDFRDNRKPTQAVAGPQATFTVTPIALPHADIQAVMMGNAHVLLWGWADYDDALAGFRHRTEFCFEMAAQPTGDGDIFVDFRQYGRFNGADEECMYQPKPYSEYFHS